MNSAHGAIIEPRVSRELSLIVLQARVGDKIKYKQNTKAGSAKVQAGRDRFNLYAFVGRKGDLSFSVSR